MGTFAEIYCMENTEIQNKEEFIEKVEKVFQYGGMMEFEEVRLYGKKLILLRKATMNSTGMKFHYNYFEDDSWESAGFSKERCKVWSRMIGWLGFRKAIVAAYVLQEQYTKGTSITIVNNNFVTSWSFVGWLNYLFDEHKHVKNFDTWKLFEEYYYSDNKYPKWNDWEQWDYFGDKRYAFISKCEIHAVIYGVDKTLEKFKDAENGDYEKFILQSMQGIKEALKNISEVEEIKDDICCKIMNILKMYYKNEDYKKELDLYEEVYKELFLVYEFSDAL